MARKKKLANAYEALAEVRRRILAEPKNYYQDELMILPEYRETKGLPKSCGTAYCVAGWFQVLTGTGDAWRVLSGSIDEPLVPTDEVHDLFCADTVAGKPGTATYAKRGATRINKFMRKWKTSLLATPVQP